MLPSIARNFFQQIKDAPDPVEFIRCLINSSPPTCETDWLEFKVGDDPAIKDKGKLKEDQKRIWSKVLSAFANSGGGVLVWGIKAAKDKATQIDAATDYCPVPHVHQFVTMLQELHRQASDPPVLNVAYLPVPQSGTDPSGFVVCWVPESTFKPHRAEYVEGKPFFIRAGDNSVVMSRSMLQTLFYPQVRARFRIRADLTWHRRAAPEDARTVLTPFACYFEITNDGNGTAASPFVQLQHHLDLAYGRKPKIVPAEDWSDDKLPDASVERKRPLHPGAKSRFLVVEWETSTRPSPDQETVFVPYCPPPAFTIDVYSENQQRQVFEVRFPPESLLSAVATTVEATPTE